jgi:hypothetical protein
MTSANAWQAIKARLATTQWLIIAATIFTALGWLDYDHPLVMAWSFHLKLLSLPLVLAFMAGAFPSTAPFNPSNSEDFWQVASISFKLFLIVLAIVLMFFRLNIGN